MADFVKQPTPITLIQWTISSIDNTSDIETVIIGSDAIEVTRYDGTADVVLRFVDGHTGDAGCVQNAGVVWVGLNPNRTNMSDRLVVVADNGGVPSGYSTFDSVYGG